MKILKPYLSLFIFFIVTFYTVAQNESIIDTPVYTIKGSVIESETRKPIPRVNVQVVGGDYTTTNVLGDFAIRAKKGDELIIKHFDFETVYYTIVNSDDIVVEVNPNQESDSKFKSSKRASP
ncbi:MAG TPA: carboxypeptidase-like regulatory domain-containing protein, partial [Flavobacteriaceae bacterium]|nr:carboxypeptidase-like regulatory domain-containing protein [Flavobacteriaceae bacterium]